MYRTAFRASSSVSLVSAAMMAITSPINLGVSVIKKTSALLWGLGTSAAVSTAFTPGIALAADTSMDVMRQWGAGLYTLAAYSIPGIWMSPA